MDFHKLSFSDRLAMINLAAVLANLKVVKIRTEQLSEGEIVDALAEQAEYLLNKSKFLQSS